ncbi:MAG: TlpA family protein disulfide reductase [Phycisphaerales bacterium]
MNRVSTLLSLPVAFLLLAAGAPVSFAQDQPEHQEDDAKPKPKAPELKPDAPEQPAAVEKPADEQRDGPEHRLLRDAAEAIRAAKSLTYKARAYGTESMESMSPKTNASVWMMRDESGNWLVRAKGTGQGRSGGDQEFDVAWRRETVEFVDHKEKKVVERRPREARSGALQIASASRIAELVGPNPYATLFAATSLTLEDRQSVAGVDCDVLVATSGAKKSKVRWCFGVEDRLPRKVEKIIEGEKVAGSMVVEISEIEASRDESKVTAAQARVEAPKDYAEDRFQPRGAQDAANAELPAGEQAKVDAENARLFGGGSPQKGQPAEEKLSEDEIKTREKLREAQEAEAKAKAQGGEPAPKPANPPVPAGPAAPTPQPAPAAAPVPVTKLPAFEITSASGNKVSVDSLKGSVVVIDFFGSWMPQKSWQPALNASIKDVTDVKIYAASVREKSQDAAGKALKDRSISWEHLPNADQLAKDLGIKVFPATVVVGKDGSIVEIFQNCRGDETAARVKAAAENARK